MDAQYTAIVKREGDWWVGWIEEVPGVNCQERTRKELLETLRRLCGKPSDLTARMP